jgi:hypothetical protein
MSDGSNFHNNDNSSFIKCGKFLLYMSDYRRLNNDSAPFIYYFQIIQLSIQDHYNSV